MKSNCLAAVVAFGLMASGASMASDSFDDRWYISARTGVMLYDSERRIEDDLFWAAGVGKYLTPNWSLDLELSQDSGDIKAFDGKWRNREINLTNRHYFRDHEVWRPYLSWGVGSMRHRADLPSGNRIRGSNFLINVGAGLEGKVSDRVSLRSELGYRFDANDKTLANTDDYGDWKFGVGMSIRLGRAAPPPAPPPVDPPPPPPPPPPVQAEEPPCPPARPGQIVGPDGCPIDVVIDLRGVNFDFDRSTLRPESISTLDEAVKILKQYEVIRVEVAGHTCNIGSADYNQGLSERRAKVVFDYLVNNGIASDRLNWTGYGLTQPIATNATREGREENRRTELRVRND